MRANTAKDRRGYDLLVDSLEGRTFLSAPGNEAAVAPINAGRPPQSLVYALKDKICGSTLGQWGDAWWKWAFSSTNPNFIYGQDVGKVFFLTGMVSPDVSVTVPSGTPLIFPIWNNEWSDFEGYGNTLQQLDYWNDIMVSHLSSATVTIDGTDIPHADTYLAESSQLQQMVLPAHNAWSQLFGGGMGVDVPTPIVFAQDGYWMGVKPLSPGQHTIHFTQTADFKDGDVLGPSWVIVGDQQWPMDVTFHITVVPQGHYVDPFAPATAQSAKAPVVQPFSNGGKKITGSVLDVMSNSVL